MESRPNGLLYAFPFVLAFFLIGCYTVIPKSGLLSYSSSAFIESEEYCGECEASILSEDCRNSSLGPVLGGVDFVQYFTEFRLANGSYDETQVGSVGSASYSYVFNGYSFYFKSEANKDLFASNPTKYAPQYGGFCTWGVTGEFCPKYIWYADCLGAKGSWDAWTIVDERLFFFKGSTPRSKFKADVHTYMAAGDKRWSDWFGDESYSQFDTNCYTESS